MLRLCALLLLAGVAVAAPAALYKCPQAGGRVLYQDVPCADGSGEFTPPPLNNMSSRIGTPRGPLEPEQPRDPDRWYHGLAGYDMARDESRRTGVPLLVYYFTDWCGYCRRMDEQILPRNDVRRQLQGFVKVRINPEQGEDERALADSMDVRGYPTVLAIDARGGQRKMRDVVTAGGFLAGLRRAWAAAVQP